jgi:UDP-glucose 4-epimerase
MNSKKVLVTGGAGYIGAHVALELHNTGYVPVIVDNLSRSDRTLLNGLRELTGQELIFCKGDCLDKAFLKTVFADHEIEGAIHFAAYKAVGESVEEPLLYYRNNLESLISVLEIMNEFGVTDIIFSSSCTVYGQPDSMPVTESAPFKKAESPYGATKQMCERILEDTYPKGYRSVSLRYFNPIGAHPTSLLGEIPVGVPGNLVPYVTQTAIGKRERLTVFGNDYNTPDGSNIRDYIHVVDLAKAHVRAFEFLQIQNAPFYEVFNLGTGKGVSVLELIRKFEQVTGVGVKYEIGARRPGDVEKTYADCSKANRILRWRAERSLEDALLDAWNWEKKIQTKD